jgi:drug/metabolite transporter (DMT)-like permease
LQQGRALSAALLHLEGAPMTRRIWLLFAVFCVLSSVDWLLPVTDAPSSLMQQCLIYASVGAIAVTFSRRLHGSLTLAMYGVALLGLPAVLLSLASTHLPDVTITVIFALVPAMVVLLIIQQDDNAHGLLMPAIAAFAGLLFVLPVNFPVSAMARLWLIAPLTAALLAAIASVRIYGVLQEIPLLPAAVTICLTNAVVLLIACMATGQATLQRTMLHGLFSLSTAVHIAILLLLLSLLRTMPPARLAARFLAVPLLTVFEGFVLLRPEPTWRMGLGFVLAVIGTILLLREKGTAEGSSLSLR